MRTEDIVNKIFSRSFMGYDMEQVDAFLDELIDSIEQYESDKREMLSAIEYLLGKLESGDRLPVAEMRKAIGAGKPRAKQRAALPEHAESVREAEAKPALRPAEEDAAGVAGKGGKQKPAARALRRGSGAAPAHKPSQAPRVKRVASRPEPVAIEYETQESAPAREDWLDELLSSLPAGGALEREVMETAAQTPQGLRPAEWEAAPAASERAEAAMPATEYRRAPEAAPAEEAEPEADDLAAGGGAQA